MRGWSPAKWFWGVLLVSLIGASIIFRSPSTTAPTSNSGSVSAEPSPTILDRSLPTMFVPPTRIVPTLEVATGFHNDNWPLVLADPDKYKGAPLSLMGRVFVEPEVASDYIALQVYTRNDATDGNTIVYAPASGATKIKKDDYVRFEGTLLKAFEGTNRLGGKLVAPLVLADKIEVISRAEAIAPAIKVAGVNSFKDQHGLVITLQKVEWAAKETRMFVRIENKSQLKLTAFTSSAALVQGTKQLNAKRLYGSEYPDIPSDMLPGIEVETVIVFDAVDPSMPAKLIWDGPHLSDYSLKFTAYVWDLPSS